MTVVGRPSQDHSWDHVGTNAQEHGENITRRDTDGDRIIGDEAQTLSRYQSNPGAYNVSVGEASSELYWNQDFNGDGFIGNPHEVAAHNGVSAPAPMCSAAPPAPWYAAPVSYCAGAYNYCSGACSAAYNGAASFVGAAVSFPLNVTSGVLNLAGDVFNGIGDGLSNIPIVGDILGGACKLVGGFFKSLGDIF